MAKYWKIIRPSGHTGCGTGFWLIVQCCCCYLLVTLQTWILENWGNGIREPVLHSFLTLTRKGKYHCRTDLLFYLLRFSSFASAKNNSFTPSKEEVSCTSSGYFVALEKMTKSERKCWKKLFVIYNREREKKNWT